MPVRITIYNDGPLITETDFWRQDCRSVCVTVNAGTYRLLIPRGLEDAVDDMIGAREVVLRRGDFDGLDAFELLFEDGSDEPFAVHAEVTAFLGPVPSQEEIGRPRKLAVWCEGAGGQPDKRLEFRCQYLGRVASLPCLEPAPSN